MVAGAKLSAHISTGEQEVERDKVEVRNPTDVLPPARPPS